MHVDPRDSSASLPRMLVVGNFAQRRRPEPLAERVPHEVNRKTLGPWLRSLGAWLEMGVPNVLDPHGSSTFSIQLGPRAIAKLTPDAIVAAIPVFAGMQERQLALRGLRNLVACINPFRKLMNAALVQPNLREQLVADIEASRAETSEPPSVVRELLDIAKMGPDDENYNRAVLGIRHMFGERLAKGATTIDTSHVAAEADRIAALLGSQVAHVLQHPSFRALECAWYGLEMVLRYESHARVYAVTCTDDEFRDYAAALSTWLHPVRHEKTPYAAVLLAFDLDLNQWLHEHLLEQLAAMATEASIPILVGISAMRIPISPQPFLVPLTSRAPVRPSYGEEDDHWHVRSFPFDEPPGGPAAACWVSGIPVLGQELGIVFVQAK